MSLSDWIREYREYPIDDSRRAVRRPSLPRQAVPEPPPEETAAPYSVASADRLRDREPRWLRRAERVGYGPVRQS